jgi:hypothetical protein
MLAHDFFQEDRLIRAGFESAFSFLSELSIQGPGIYGNPHLHDNPMHTPMAVGKSAPLSKSLHQQGKAQDSRRRADVQVSPERLIGIPDR